MLAAASSAAESRRSGQGGLFGEGPDNVVPIRMPSSEAWPLATRMAQEKEAFGFYFSAHPVDAFRHIAEAHGARTHEALSEMAISSEGRVGAVMAALVEDVRRRTSARGRRYLTVTLSDRSGQFEASIFDEAAADQAEAAARAGSCALLSVDLDRRPGDETPRIVIRSLETFESLSRRNRLQVRIETSRPEALREMAQILDRRGGQGSVLVRARFEGGDADLVLGRDFLLDAEVAARLERIEGVDSVHLAVQEPPRLALVS